MCSTLRSLRHLISHAHVVRPPDIKPFPPHHRDPGNTHLLSKGVSWYPVATLRLKYQVPTEIGGAPLLGKTGNSKISLVAPQSQTANTQRTATCRPSIRSMVAKRGCTGRGRKEGSRPEQACGKHLATHSNQCNGPTNGFQPTPLRALGGRSFNTLRCKLRLVWRAAGMGSGHGAWGRVHPTLVYPAGYAVSWVPVGGWALGRWGFGGGVRDHYIGRPPHRCRPCQRRLRSERERGEGCSVA